MGRTRDPKQDEAKMLYKDSDGKMALIDIATKLDIPVGTVRSWKLRYNWDDTQGGDDVVAKEVKKNIATLQKVKRNATRETQRNAKGQKEPKQDAVKDFEPEIENDDLTDKQRIFCIYYVKTFNQTMSAIKAGYTKERAHITGSELVRNSKVRSEIQRLKGKMTDSLMVDAMDVLNKYAEIAFADISDYVEFGQEEVPLYTKKGTPILTEEGAQATAKQSFVALKNAGEVDGTIISEVKEGKDGVSIKLQDKMKALEMLTRYFDLLPDKHKRMVEEEKLKIERERLELEKAKAAGEGDLDEELIDDWVGAVMEDGTDDAGDKEGDK
jgi:phage terminase small subunit